MMTYADIIEIVSDHERLIKFCQAHDLLNSSSNCVKCLKAMNMVADKSRIDGLVFRCRQCFSKRSLRSGTFLERSKLNLRQAIVFFYLWCHSHTRTFIMNETKIGSYTTYADYVQFNRDICVGYTKTHCQPIGGPGKIVEIDESKFGKRKYHRGRQVDGHWVLGGVERGDCTKIFAVVVEKRDADTLIPIIQQMVLPGTTIITDCWRSYSSLANMDYEYLKINHSVEFVSKENSLIHTNTIESNWRAMKACIGQYRHDNLMDSLAEFFFRRHARKEEDIFLFFLQAIAKSYPLNK